ncbi:MAG: hypothetical protein QOH10_1800, partial [Actinomycetota bacterium]|nr:hypothetical protein [Actinomycetota bacterium]
TVDSNELIGSRVVLAWSRDQLRRIEDQ